MMTDVRYRVANTKCGPRIEICIRRPDGTFLTSAINWRSKPEVIEEADLNFSFEAAKDKWYKLLGK